MQDQESAANALDVQRGMFGEMSKRFNGQAGAFAYLLFILLYFPCVATIGVIAKEAGKPWAAFVAFWSTSVAYISASLFYQLAQLSNHPTSAIVTILLILGYALAIFIGLRRYAGKRRDTALGTA